MSRPATMCQFCERYPATFLVTLIHDTWAVGTPTDENRKTLPMCRTCADAWARTMPGTSTKAPIGEAAP